MLREKGTLTFSGAAAEKVSVPFFTAKNRAASRV